MQLASERVSRWQDLECNVCEIVRPGYESEAAKNKGCLPEFMFLCFETSEVAAAKAEKESGKPGPLLEF